MADALDNENVPRLQSGCSPSCAGRMGADGTVSSVRMDWADEKGE